jgi:hypothetical protein
MVMHSSETLERLYLYQARLLSLGITVVTELLFIFLLLQNRNVLTYQLKNFLMKNKRLKTKETGAGSSTSNQYSVNLSLT